MITIFGASVTAQKSGYAKYLEKQLDAEVKIFGYGGMHLNNAAICFIDEVVDLMPSYCFIDFFSTAYVEKTDATKLYIDVLLYKMSLIQCRPIFLFFPKHDENLTIWYDFCRSYLDSKGVYYIDITSIVKKEEVNALLRDNVHTTAKGSKVYSEIILEKFRKNKDKILIPSGIIKNKYSSIKHLTIERVFTKSVQLLGEVEIVGILNTIGPYSGIVSISIDNKNFGESSLWDQWCTYSRKHFNLSFTFKEKAKINILQKDINNKKYKLSHKHKKKIIIHSIYYIGKDLKILNLNEGKDIPYTLIFLQNTKTRIIQRLFKFMKNMRKLK